MTVLNLRLFSVPTFSGILAALREKTTQSHDEVEITPPVRTAEPEPKMESIDRARYERILDHELDRQLLTEVEREDSEMLARVRDALYADD